MYIFYDDKFIFNALFSAFISFARSISNLNVAHRMKSTETPKAQRHKAVIFVTDAIVDASLIVVACSV